jgi:hypothetical protein
MPEFEGRALIVPLSCVMGPCLHRIASVAI